VAFFSLAWLGWKDLLTGSLLPSDRAALVDEPEPVDAEAASARAPWSRVPPADERRELAGTPAPAGETGRAPAAAPIPTVSESGSDPSAGPSEHRARAVLRAERRPARVSGEPEASRPEAEEAPDKPRSRMALGGWVLDRDGNPVADLPIAARLRRLLASLDAGSAGGPAAEQRAATDGAGRFAFPDVPDGEYELRTDATELYEKASTVVRAGVDSAVLVVEARARRALLVHGIVESTRGGPVAGVRVEVAGQPGLATASDEAGRYGLRVTVSERSRETVLRFARSGYREVRLPVDAGETTDLVQDVRLEPAGQLATVSGVLTGEEGSPVARASVQLYSEQRGRRYQAVSDASGRFTLASVEESDDYRLWVHPARGYRDHTRDGVEVREPGPALTVKLESLGTGSLRGSMVDAEGRPLPGFTLWLRTAFGAGASTAVTGDAQGRFATGELPEGPVALETRAAPQLGVTGISLASGTPREVVIPLDVGGHELEGTLRAENGGPVGGARVSLHWSRADGGVNSRSFRETTSDATGRFVFTQLGAGVHTLSATAAGFRSARLDQAVGLGAPPVEIKLAASP
jgi:protocatechuate 3,4-dioxygenase beta subunit